MKTWTLFYKDFCLTSEKDLIVAKIILIDILFCISACTLNSSITSLDDVRPPPNDPPESAVTNRITSIDLSSAAMPERGTKSGYRVGQSVGLVTNKQVSKTPHEYIISHHASGRILSEE